MRIINVHLMKISKNYHLLLLYLHSTDDSLIDLIAIILNIMCIIYHIYGAKGYIQSQHR